MEKAEMEDNYIDMEEMHYAVDIPSYDGGEWVAVQYFDTKEEAIQSGLDALKEDETLQGSTLYVGQKESVCTSSIDIDLLLENVAENTTCELSEVGEDYLMDVSKEAQDELEEKLNDVFFEWIKKYNYEPTFYKIVNIEEVELLY